MRFRGSSFGIAMLAAVLFADAAGAAVVCQNGNRVKLRAETCRPKETKVATLGGGGAADLAGVWEVTGGNLFDYTYVPFRYLALNEDGTGRIHLAGGKGPLVVCAPVNWSRDPNGSLVVDDWDFLTGTRVYLSAVESGELELTDAVGQTATLERAASVDPDEDCGTLEIVERFTGLPQPDDDSGLAFDGTDLWYKTNNQQNKILSIDPTNGSNVLALDATWPYVHATQGADFWSHSSDWAVRFARPGNVEVDTIKTDDELFEYLDIRAIGYDGTSNTVWLRGWHDGQGRLFKVNAAGEPDLLVNAFDIDGDIDALTFSDGVLWGLDTWAKQVVRIDTETGKITATFVIRDRSAEWRGLAAIGDRLYVLGQGENTGTVLVFTKPD